MYVFGQVWRYVYFHVTGGNDVKIIMANNVLLYTQIDAYSNSHQSDFIQQLIGSDADSQPNIRQSLGNPKEEEKKGL